MVVWIIIFYVCPIGNMGSMMIGGVMKKIQIAIFFFFSIRNKRFINYRKGTREGWEVLPHKIHDTNQNKTKHLHYTRRTIHKGIGYLKDIQIPSKPDSIPLCLPNRQYGINDDWWGHKKIQIAIFIFFSIRNKRYINYKKGTREGWEVLPHKIHNTNQNKT